jgi:hypothetical protein
MLLCPAATRSAGRRFLHWPWGACNCGRTRLRMRHLGRAPIARAFAALAVLECAKRKQRGGEASYGVTLPHPHERELCHARIQHGNTATLQHCYKSVDTLAPPARALSPTRLRPFPPARACETGQRERVAGLFALTPRSSARSWSPCLTPIQPISIPLISISYRPDCGSF